MAILNRRLCLQTLAAGAFPGAASALDWSQWRGPARNGISSETGWKAAWGAGGPPKLWSAQVGEGWSAPAVAGNRLYTMGNQGNQDTVYCLDADTGRVVWKQSYPCSAGDYGGPRSSPVLEGGRVYTLSREGFAACLDAAGGRVLWSRHLQREARAEIPRWGFAGSPLVLGNQVLYNVGTAGISLAKANGEVQWISGPRAAGYASPVPFTAAGKSGVALFVAFGIVAIEPATGKPLWQHPWETSYDVNAADPVFSGDSVFITSGYNRGGALLRLSGSRPQVVWENKNIRSHFASPVLLGEGIYGNDDGRLTCLNVKSGNRSWEMRGIGKGGLMAAGGKLLVLTERGELVAVEARTDRYVELARGQVLRGTCWTHPVLANGRVYCRSHEGELVCLNVKG